MKITEDDIIDAIYSEDYSNIIDKFKTGKKIIFDAVVASNLISEILSGRIGDDSHYITDKFSLKRMIGLLRGHPDDLHAAMIEAINAERIDLMEEIFKNGYTACNDAFQEALMIRNRDIIDYLLQRGCQYPPARWGTQPIQCDIVKLLDEEDQDQIEEFRELEREQSEYFLRLFPLQEESGLPHFYIVAYKDTPQGRILCGSMLVENQDNEYYVRLFATQTPTNRIVRGIGERMMLYLIEDAKRHGIQTIRLMPKETATSFYESLGFVPSEEDEEYYEMIL